MQLLFEETGPGHVIRVYDTNELYGEKGRFRVLQFANDAIQGALDLNNPGRILFEYPRAIVHLMEMNRPAFENVFMIGHGIGTLAGHYPQKRFTIAEHDPKVVELSRTYFGCDQENIILGDGREILDREPPEAYDYLILDAFTEKGTPRHLVSRQFFELSRSKLNPDGAILMNLFGKSMHDNHISAIYTTLGEVFSHRKAFYLPSEGTRDTLNILLAGGSSPLTYQARHMAGFVEFEPEQGYLITDRL
ncbi:spermidine synthase [Paenibacillus sp. RC84]|uniref:spermidine synthase n=1 Tax=Paenibacillus sp. RC84 TaxID=3156252 RepID=UPI003515E0BA